MNNTSLSDGEWKLMNQLWDKSPLTILDMTLAVRSTVGWSKATVNMMINRLAEKGAVRIDASERTKRVYPILKREDAVRAEAKNTLEKIRTGGLSLLLSAMTEDCSLSEAEIDELTRILKEGGK